VLTLYHGSNISFETPSLAYARDKRDFGVGFYTTLLRYFKANNQVSLHTKAAMSKFVLKAREQLD